jgi:hypothetical protein
MVLLAPLCFPKSFTFCYSGFTFTDIIAEDNLSKCIQSLFSVVVVVVVDFFLRVGRFLLFLLSTFLPFFLAGPTFCLLDSTRRVALINLVFWLFHSIFSPFESLSVRISFRLEKFNYRNSISRSWNFFFTAA